MYNELYDFIFDQLCKNYAAEEAEMQQVVQGLQSSGKLNPLDYGQDKKLADCRFMKSGQQLSAVNSFKTPFEKIGALRVAHKQMVAEINYFTRYSKSGRIELNEDIVIASLMLAFLNSNLEHPIVNMFLMQHFSFVDYSVGESGKFLHRKPRIALMLLNYVTVVEKFRQIVDAKGHQGKPSEKVEESKGSFATAEDTEKD